MRASNRAPLSQAAARLHFRARLGHGFTFDCDAGQHISKGRGAGDLAYVSHAIAMLAGLVSKGRSDNLAQVAKIFGTGALQIPGKSDVRRSAHPQPRTHESKELSQVLQPFRLFGVRSQRKATATAGTARGPDRTVCRRG